LELARRAVQAAERKPLHLAVEATAAKGRFRRARVGQVRLAEPDRTEGQLDDEQRCGRRE
jgi:hypothetical protein